MSLFKSPTDTTDLHRFILAINGRRIPQISKQKICEISVPFYPKTEQVKNLCKSVKSVGQRKSYSSITSKSSGTKILPLKFSAASRV